MQDSLAGSEVLGYCVYVPVTCVYVGQPLVVAGSRNHPLLKAATALIDQPGYEYSATIGGSNDGRLIDLGTAEVVPMSVSLSSLLPLGIILCLTVWLHLYPG